MRRREERWKRRTKDWRNKHNCLKWKEKKEKKRWNKRKNYEGKKYPSREKLSNRRVYIGEGERERDNWWREYMQWEEGRKNGK